MKRLLIFFTLFLFPIWVHAQSDLSINAQDIRFSSSTLIAGDLIRIYATIYNVGDEDVSGYVSFYQGATLIDDSSVISLPTGGSPEEVYIDFIVPKSSFNILALVSGTDPVDANAGNDSALTSVFTPILDDDRDGIGNEADNCPTTSNATQLDTDLDGEGDTCDIDDDNDGLSDDVEAELHTNTTGTDSDDDGIADPDDAFPLDERLNVIEQQEPAVSEPSMSPGSEAFQKIIQEVAQTIEETAVTVSEPLSESASSQDASDTTVSEVVSESEVQISPHAVFSYTRDDWNTFTFTVLTHASDHVVTIWNFGDGVTSSKSSVQHVYNTSGAFPVTLTMTDAHGAVVSESTTVFVPFFHLNNRIVLASVLMLIVLLSIGVMSFIRLGHSRD